MIEGSYPHYVAWRPEPLGVGYTIDLQPQGAIGPRTVVRGVLSRVNGDENEIILIVNGYDGDPELAEYEAYKRLCYYKVFGVLPQPPVVAIEEAPSEQIVDGFTVVPEFE